ncbi:alpha/beta hydrolase [Georgenia sp. EYE_87]|uniref:alpha/beta fold hydrolase n=1 Tax=Georgenia sp. EYE_87 TaxID=2853448 RepID=UPI002002A79C|nr:alpha/beta hydrolase [Georgenia sp. EYE_87]MCK6211932.1 alpha/beta hydrolase [Georgenia sp. EYE_87]
MPQEAGAPELRTVRITDDLTLQYAEQGRPDGEPVVLLHGYTDSWFSFSRLLPLLPPELHVLAPSQRGHGDSSRPDDGYTTDDFAGDVLSLLDAVGLERATIVGHSGGSFTARRVAQLAPGRVTRLALLGSAPTALTDGTRELRDAVLSLTDPVPDEFAREFQASTIYRPVPAEFLERVVAESLKLPARVWTAALDGLLGHDDSAELARVGAPTLVLWGDKDGLFTREDQESLVAALPDARLVAYPETGHALHWERPEEVARDLVDFLLAG